MQAGVPEASVSARIASPSPRSARTGGLIPRTRARSSTSALAEFSRDSAASATAASGLVLISRSMDRSEIPSATIRACAPSCRSRSILRSSAAAVSTASTRVTVSRRTRASSSLLRRASPEWARWCAAPATTRRPAAQAPPLGPPDATRHRKQTCAGGNRPLSASPTATGCCAGTGRTRRTRNRSGLPPADPRPPPEPAPRRPPRREPRPRSTGAPPAHETQAHHDREHHRPAGDTQPPRQGIQDAFHAVHGGLHARPSPWSRLHSPVGREHLPSGILAG